MARKFKKKERERERGYMYTLEKEMAIPLVFLPGNFHGQRSLASYGPWGREESATTEQLGTYV